MKPKFTALMLTPKYVTQFRCLGGECPDTCCKGWTISVDKDSFLHYQQATLPALQPLFKSHLIQLDKGSEANHGKFKLPTPDANCPMHSSQGLCEIQQNLGEDALPDTCYTYPRSILKVGDRFEQSLTLSCPEAARLALTQDDAFEFVSTSFTSLQSTTIELGSVHGFNPLAIDEVRVLCIQLFQTAELSLKERFVLLGWLCNQLEELVGSNSQANALEVLKQLTELVESGRLHSVVAQHSSYPELAANVFAILFGSPTGKGASSNQREIATWVSHGLGFDSAGTVEPSVLEENYLRGLSYLKTNATLIDQTLSRYLLNDLLREMFPWGRSSLMAHYRRLLTRFGILRLMLAAVAAEKNCPPDQEMTTRVIQVFCRMYQHNEAFSARAEHLLTGADWDKLDRLYTLL